MDKMTHWMLVASLFLAIGLTGCSKDKNSSEQEIAGKPTAMTLRLAFPRTGDTRATADPNATDDEAAIKTADVYVFTESGAYLSHTTLTAGQFSTLAAGSNYDVYQATTTIPTTTGTKNIYVGVNLPAATAASLEDQTMSHTKTQIQVIQRSEISITNGLPMFSTAAVTQVLVEDAAANTVTANVRRLVAKVTVETDPDVDMSAVPGQLGDIYFAINNQNSKFFLQQGPAPGYADPNWTTASYLGSDFSAATAADYVQASTGPQNPVANYNALYALENTSEHKTEKELTRVTIRATFIPGQIVTNYTIGSGTVTSEANTAQDPETFWTVTPAVGQDIVFFNNQTAANDYATDKGVSAAEYTDGYCYWNIFLNKAADWDVLRNDYYKCNITRIVAPGQPTPNLTNPDVTPETDTELTVVVNVLFWNTPILGNYELVP